MKSDTASGLIFEHLHHLVDASIWYLEVQKLGNGYHFDGKRFAGLGCGRDRPTEKTKVSKMMGRVYLV